MMRTRLLLLCAAAALVVVACDRGEAPAPEAPVSETQPTEAGEPSEAEAPTEPAEEAEAPTQEDALVDGVFHAHSFNIRFNLPEGWERAEQLEAGQAGMAAEEGSLVFTGPEESTIQMVVANTESIQLVDNSFAALNDRISLTNVTLVPDRSERRTFNGIPGYRTEGDATLRGEGMPVYFIAQALELPGDPVMVTLFIEGDKYFEHSRTMTAVLDSIEVIDFRR